MPEQFFGREIKVITGGEVRTPVSFTLDGREHTVREVLESWQDAGFGHSETSRTWRTRHHRSYFRVETVEGEVYEMYFDRGTSLRHPQFRKWYLTRRLKP
jgi:hypothetical protein